MKRILCVLIAIMLLVGAALAEAGQAIDPEAQSLGLEGVGNARELGGYPTGDGRTVKWGAFLRTAALGGATEADIQKLRDDYHLAVVLDLRMTREIEAAPDPEIEGVENLHLGIIDEEAMAAARASLTPEELEGLDTDNPVDRLRMYLKLGVIGENMYISFLSSGTGKAGYTRMFRELIELPEGEAMLFHCTQGKDRTGCAAMLILTALGVDEETILADYLLTNTFNASLIESERQTLIDAGIEGEELDTLMTTMDQVNVQYMINGLDWLKENYGSALNYITAELGVTGEEIELLRNKYLEGEIEYEDAA